MAAEGEALRELYVRFSAEVEGADDLDKLDHAAEGAKEHVKEAGEHAEKAGGFFHELGEKLTGVAAIFAGSELLHGIRETTESLEQLAHLSEQTGIATETLEFYGFVVGQVGGDVADFRGNLSALQRALSSTERATAPQTAALKKLGIETAGLKDGSVDMNEILPQIFENFGNLKSPAEEAAVATRLFGRSGLSLLPVLREGAKGFEEYRAQFEATGGATPQESIERAKEYERALKLMNAAFGDLKTHLVTGVLPALTHVVEGVTNFTAGLSSFLKGTTASEHAALGLAAAFAGPVLAALGPFLLPGLQFLGIYAAVDDLLGFLDGKDSLIGRALDSLFGDDASKQARAWVQGVIDDFKTLNATSGGIFTAIAEGLTVALADMGIAVDEFFLDWYKKWNELVGKTGGKLGLTIDTKLAEDELASLKKTKDDIAKNAYERMHPEESAARREREANDKRNASEAAAHGGGGATQAQQDAFAAQLRNDPQALYRALKQQARDRNNAAAGPFGPAPAAPGAPFGPPTLTQEKNPQAVFRELQANARQRAKDQEVATLATAAYAGANGTLVRGEQGTGTRVVNDNRVVNVHVDAKAGDDLKRQIKQAVSEAMRDDGRTTQQQLTQRGEK